MLSPRPGASARCFFLAMVAVAAGQLSGVHSSRAQQPQSSLYDRIMHPDMNAQAAGFDRSFDTKSSGTDRQAAVHAFNFGHAANLKAGDGVFRTKNFNSDKGGFHTGSYATKAAATANQSASVRTDRAFDVRTVPVQADRAVGKTVAVSDYVPGGKPFLIPGKRQDDIDELRKQKNLTSDQVREILNKNN